MRVTRKIPDLGSILVKHADQGEEIAPNLHLHHLPGEIEGMPDKGGFEAHIKGKVREHTKTNRDGKTHHSYDLDVHSVECKKKRQSPRDSVDKAFERWREEEAKEPEHK